METGTATVENSMEVSQNIQNRTTSWPSNPSSEYIPENSKTFTHTYMRTPTFIAALFTIAQKWQQRKRPSVDDWISTGLTPACFLWMGSSSWGAATREGWETGLKRVWNRDFYEISGFNFDRTVDILGSAGKKGHPKSQTPSIPPKNCLWLLIELYSEEHQVPSETWSWNRLIRCH